MKFHIPAALREFAAGRSQVEIEHQAGTLNSALSVLYGQSVPACAIEF